MSAENQTVQKRFALPFFSFVPPWAAPATQPAANFTPISSLIALPTTAPYSSAIPTAFPDNTSDSMPSPYGYVTTTDNIIIPVTVQGPPQETIYPIATQGFNYYASGANHVTPFSIILVILWALLFCSLFRKRMIVNFES